jgi:hypothetical protein
VYTGTQLILLLYFNLIIKQWDTILNNTSKITTLANAILIFVLILLMRKLDMAVSLLGYGLISILGYMIFVFWLIASAPSGPNKYPIATWEFADLYNALATAFSLQGIFIPILRKNKIPSQNGSLVLLSFLLGGIIYTYIGFAGSFGTIKLNQVFSIENQQVTTPRLWRTTFKTGSGRCLE